MSTFNLFKLLLLILIFKFYIATKPDNNDLPEITSEEIIDFEYRYVNEEKDTEKRYLELVVRPERFDLNKDRKISRDEVRKALLSVFYSKDEKINKQIPEEVNEHIRNNVDLFVKQIKKDFLNFRQFQYLMRKITLMNFMNTDVLESKLKAKKENYDEGEREL